MTSPAEDRLCARARSVGGACARAADQLPTVVEPRLLQS